MINKIFFILGYNVSNFFRKNKYKMNFIDTILTMMVLLYLVSVPLVMFFYSNELTLYLANKYDLFEYSLVDIEISIQFALVIIYTLTFMVYYVSKISFLEKSSSHINYLVDSYCYTSNINGRVKKIHLQKVESEDNQFEQELIMHIVPFRRLKIGSKVEVLTRKYKGINVSVLLGDKKTIILGFSLIIIFELIVGCLFLII